MMSTMNVSSSSTSTGRRRWNLFGIFGSQSPSQGDLEAQHQMTSESSFRLTSLPSIIMPSPSLPRLAHASSSSPRSRPMYTDALDNFFGAPGPTRRPDSLTGTRSSRHDEAITIQFPPLSSDDDPDVSSNEDDDSESTKPPSYYHAVSDSPSHPTDTPQLPHNPPTYSQTVPQPALYPSKKSPPTLAMYLFKYGFLCPLFWAFGAFLLVWPLSPPESALPMVDPEMRTLVVKRIRDTEVKWATRCLAALVSVLSLVLLAVVLTLAVSNLST